MNLSIRAMIPLERMYSYTQSSQIESQSGCIGHLRADMGSDGKGFFSSWTDHRGDLKTEDFKNDFDELITVLRSDKLYGATGTIRNSAFVRIHRPIPSCCA